MPDTYWAVEFLIYDGDRQVESKRFVALCEEDHRRGPAGFVVRLRRVEIEPSALKHGVPVEDIEHALRNAMVTDELEDDLRLYLGPARNGSLLEIIILARDDDRPDVAIHAMPLRSKYQRLLPGEGR